MTFQAMVDIGFDSVRRFEDIAKKWGRDARWCTKVKKQWRWLWKPKKFAWSRT